MVTVRDIIQRASIKANVVGYGENLPAEYASEGLSAFNEMLHAWKARGVDVSHSDLDLNSTFPLPDQFREGVIYLLAARMSHEFRLPSSFREGDWFRGVQAYYAVVPTLTVEPALTIPPSRRDREESKILL